MSTKGRNKNCPICSNVFLSSRQYKSYCSEACSQEGRKIKQQQSSNRWHEKEESKVLSTLRNIQQRAKEKNIDFSLSVEDIASPPLCPVFGFELERNKGIPKYNSPSVDRIDPTKGYTKDNIQVISQLANSMKQNATKEQLIQFAEWVLRTYRDSDEDFTS